jgi:serine/threonine protein kinase
MPPLVPGFVTTGAVSTSVTGSECGAVRSLDGRPFVLRFIPVADVTQAQGLAAQHRAVCKQIENEHLVRQHDAIAMADGTLALVFDEVKGGSLAQLLGARGQLTPGETVTTVVPLLGLLADLHAAGLVHGDLAPGSILFSEDGRPMIADLGTARLLDGAGRSDGTASGGPVAGGFMAPELLGGADPTPASDVFAMAALGWFCLTGAAPAPGSAPASLTALRPTTPSRLVELLTSCLAADPATRPPAGVAAIALFDAAPAESVALAPVTDPAAEITRRIRAAAASVSGPPPRTTRRSFQAWLGVGMVGLLVAVALGVGATWFLRPQVETRPAVVPSATRPSPASKAMSGATRATGHPPASATIPTSSPATVLPTRASPGSKGLVTDSSSPRSAPARLLQGLVDARALAYVTRSSSLLDLVYAPGAGKAGFDRGNIAGALKNGGTYLGLSFVVRDVAFLDGTTDTARIRATIFTPAYWTGQPDGRKIPHAQEILGPCIFSLSLTPDGWRILALTVI